MPKEDFEVDDVVCYRPHWDAKREWGKIIKLTDRGAFVLYEGDSTAKLTNYSDLMFN